jgi:hypothetical protein
MGEIVPDFLNTGNGIRTTLANAVSFKIPVNTLLKLILTYTGDLTIYALCYIAYIVA